jgi:hypothetical protein
MPVTLEKRKNSSTRLRGIYFWEKTAFGGNSGEIKICICRYSFEIFSQLTLPKNSWNKNAPPPWTVRPLSVYAAKSGALGRTWARITSVEMLAAISTHSIKCLQCVWHTAEVLWENKSAQIVRRIRQRIPK